MFKELGEFIDAAGIFVSEVIKKDVDIIKRSLKNEEEEPLCGDIIPFDNYDSEIEIVNIKKEDIKDDDGKL